MAFTRTFTPYSCSPPQAQLPVSVVRLIRAFRVVRVFGRFERTRRLVTATFARPPPAPSLSLAHAPLVFNMDGGQDG
jgi:hypothetical protein